MELFVLIMFGFVVWMVVSIIEVLIDHFTPRCFYIGVLNKVRIMALVVIMGMIVAYCGAST